MIAISRPEYLPVVWQATAGTLQQELQDLKAVTEQEGVAMKAEVSSLKGQLDSALAHYTAQRPFGLCSGPEPSPAGSC